MIDKKTIAISGLFGALAVIAAFFGLRHLSESMLLQHITDARLPGVSEQNTYDEQMAVWEDHLQAKYPEVVLAMTSVSPARYDEERQHIVWEGQATVLEGEFAETVFDCLYDGGEEAWYDSLPIKARFDEAVGLANNISQQVLGDQKIPYTLTVTMADTGLVGEDRNLDNTDAEVVAGYVDVVAYVGLDESFGDLSSLESGYAEAMKASGFHSATLERAVPKEDPDA